MIDQQIKTLQPLCRALALKLIRRYSLPANVTLEDLVQVGLVGAWEAIRRFDGRGKLEAFASIRIRGAMIDHLRQSHPQGRRRAGSPQAEFISIDDVSDLAGDRSPLEDVERSESVRVRLQALRPEQRKLVKRVLSGETLVSIANSKAVTSSRVTQLVRSAVDRMEKSPARTSDKFDPQSVPIIMGAKIPNPQRQRRNKMRELLDRMPATGSVVVASPTANSLVAEMKKLGIPFARRTLADGTVQVTREPSKDQFE